MIWLLDVNALIAALVSGHEHHEPVEAWLAGLSDEDGLATCSITELGFVRVMNQAPQYRVPIRDSIRLLTRFQGNQTRTVMRLTDDRGVADLAAWVKTARQTTDGHLLGLAESHGAHLATLDTGIPGAFLIPRS
ncbi:MAG: PIN domain-containing protein [Verrucomicrobiae bacterium]|nr:PIN domain-containing protein [Verrucomicrobiae bacterium]